MVLPFYLPALIFAFSQGMLVPVLPLYAGSFDVSYGLVGLMVAGQGLGMLLSDVPAGMLLRRVGQKSTMLVGITCTVLSTAALFWARSVPEVVVYRLIAGAGMALYGVSRHAYVASATAVVRRGRAIALLGGLFRIGRFAGPMVGGMVAAAFGLRTVFLLFGGASAIALVVVAVFVSATDAGSQAAASAPRPPGGHLLSTLRGHYRVLASAGAGQLFAQMIRAGRGMVIPLYAADVIGLDVQAVGFIVSLASAVDTALFYPAGLIMDHLGRKYAIVPSFVVQAVGMALLPLTGSYVSLLLVTALIGIGNGLGSGSMMTLGADLAPEHSRGEFIGVWRLIGDAGQSGGPIVAGAVADLVALPTAIWVVSCAGLIAATIFTLLVPETLKQRRRAAGPS